MSTRLVYAICYAATAGVIVAALSERDVLEWTGVVMAVGASIFAFGLGRYHEFREQRRVEDHKDRLNMIEDIRVHTRVLYEMESRQQALKKAMEVLIIEMDQTRCRFPNPDGSARCSGDEMDPKI